MAKKLKAFSILIIFALILLMMACGMLPGVQETAGPEIDIVARELPQLMIALPQEINDFYSEGYGYFLDEIEDYSYEHRFTYDVIRFSSQDELISLLAPESAEKYEWIYIHPDEGASQGLKDALDALPQEKVTVLFGSGIEGYTPDHRVFIDYFEMGVKTGERMTADFSGRISRGKLAAAFFRVNEPWYDEYLRGIKSVAGQRFDLIEMEAGDPKAAMESFLESLPESEMKDVCTIISGSGEQGKGAMEAVLSFKGSLDLKVCLVAFIGAQEEYIGDFSYSPIDQITYDIYPTMMIKAARYLKDVVTGIAQAEHSIVADLLDKENLELYKQSDEYLLRFR
ncbi:MAG: hypothetical protein ACOX8S_12125 [Christensenellales bacterium]